ncbi:hypothetical protein RUMOBE_04020 [Blautia obeum ATCC 29174]|uniref:Uncharacterized protein n=1 Tax=Blautia obeum ATCC 29174 TaxID=411459 RepID=A5ZYB1_9FIRM|nr:hypothetical protein RUMOBE_04020 [Blautia obeum ATCC 29174]
MRQEKEKRFMKAKTIKKRFGYCTFYGYDYVTVWLRFGGFCKRTGIGYFGNYRGCREYRLKRF